MMKFLQPTAILLLTAFSLPASAGDPVYPVCAIPAALKENAHVVKRTEEYTVDIRDLRDVRVTKHYVYTVLDAAGADDAIMLEYYGKLREIRSVEGILYDADGKQVKRMKQADVKDLSAVDNGSLMTDTRKKFHSFFHSVYPFTVEYRVEIRYNCTNQLPVWVPQEEYDCTVQQSSLTVTAPAGFELRYHTYLYNGEPATSSDKGIKTYIWQVKDIPAMKKEAFAEEFYKRTPSVFLAPGEFEIEDYKGRMNTWKDFGNFIYHLNQGRDVLPDNIKQKVHQLTDALPAREDKINSLYKYMQQNYRYISIQLGIGGWQTFDATTVAAKGYGDCKALSNFMMAMLKEAGISSNCVLVKSGDGVTSLREDFPSPQFDHEILCIPGAKDTMWLECTSNTLPVGYLSAFTANRPVLVIDSAASKLVRTPDYNMDYNLQQTSITATIDEAGNIHVNSHTMRTGMQQDGLHERLHTLSEEKQLEELREGLDLASYDIVSHKYKEEPGIKPAIEEQLEINGHNYATVTGKRMFVAPNILNRNSLRLEEETARKSPIRFNHAYRDIDTVKITVPAGYRLESLPAPVSLKNQFGVYTAVTEMKGNTISYIRKIEHKAGTFPVTDFADLVKFYNTIYRSDRNRLVLVKE
ncbi:MAG TPA: DUF3857 domain-containing protein [Chitinophaga sp.]|uniref:DUF3857 domain-containing transglutaminase family protein n=1 Tax=Chitinophaga sp. TaxID=1869181 RepID=UPI002C482E49|nr:DUF3857 domain-containing protein [Chitinophaga sp.]HVI48383.1 DUF3857 domain-containing protein [Chitinophaga sp.]